MAQQQMVKQEESLGDLFSDLAAHTGKLIKQEISLVQVELGHKVSNAGRNVAFLAAGGVAAFASFMVLLAAAVIILANVIPLWLSAIVVGGLVGVVAYFMISSALNELQKIEWAPRESVDSIKEDAQWIKNQVT